MKKSFALTVLCVAFAAGMPAPHAFSQNQHEMTQGAAKDFEHADAELNVIYKKALATLDETGKAKLTKAQRAWVAYRDAQATFAADSERGGSMEPMVYYAEQAKLTRERVAVLRDLVSSGGPGKQ